MKKRNHTALAAIVALIGLAALSCGAYEPGVCAPEVQANLWQAHYRMGSLQSWNDELLRRFAGTNPSWQLVRQGYERLVYQPPLGYVRRHDIRLAYRLRPGRYDIGVAFNAVKEQANDFSFYLSAALERSNAWRDGRLRETVYRLRNSQYLYSEELIALEKRYDKAVASATPAKELALTKEAFSSSLIKLREKLQAMIVAYNAILAVLSQSC